MQCPDCKGKKVIELWASVVPCEMCNGVGTVAYPVVFDPAALPIDLYAPQMPADSGFDDSFCLLMVAKEDGLLYQANDETGKCRPLGKELICMIDGYSNRDKWVDFRFYPPGGCKPSIARMTCSTPHREMDLQAIQVRHLQHYRVTPILLGDLWEITVMGYDDYQAIKSLHVPGSLCKTGAFQKLLQQYFQSGGLGHAPA